MVVTAGANRRRKTCFVGASPFSTIPEVLKERKHFQYVCLNLFQDADVETPPRKISRGDKKNMLTHDSNSASEDKPRKLSRKFSTAKLAPPEEHLEGEWTLVSTNNYDKFLAAVGAGPLSSNMVLRARINLSIKQVSGMSVTNYPPQKSMSLFVFCLVKVYTSISIQNIEPFLTARSLTSSGASATRR